MSTMDMWMLALIGVATPLICLGGIGLAYRAQERGSVKKAPGGGRHVTEHGIDQRKTAGRSALNSDESVDEGPASDPRLTKYRVDH
jgi:hypothetical protein